MNNNNNNNNNFNFIPAIDLYDKKVVRLYQGSYNQINFYEKNLYDQLCSFALAGVKWIHIVDLNAARSGKRDVNYEEFQKVKIFKNEFSKVKLEIGGGLRSITDINECLELGFDRCILGTAAIKNQEFLGEALKNFGNEAVVVGIDVLDDIVKISGWESDAKINVNELLTKFKSLGLKTIIFTDISRDGTLIGTGSLLFKYNKDEDLNFIVSGGLSNIDDLTNLLKKRTKNIVGVISGKAIYENKINLSEALDLCEKNI